MEATDNAAVVAVLSLLTVNFKETMQNFAHWRQLNKRKKKITKTPPDMDTLR